MPSTNEFRRQKSQSANPVSIWTRLSRPRRVTVGLKRLTEQAFRGGRPVPERTNEAGKEPRPSTRLLSCGIVLLTLFVGVLLGSYARTMHFRFMFSAYDVGIHLQALWKFSRLQGMFNTVRGLNYWGDHLWFSMVLLAPLYRLWTSPTLVYLYQGLGLAAGGLAVYGLARCRLQSRIVAVVPVLLYWCYPGMIYTAQENFHPEAVGSTWLLLMLWAQEAGRPRLFWTGVVLALLTKEDIALYLLGYAAYAFVLGQRRRAVTLALVSGGYFLIAMKVLLPFFNGVGFFRLQGGYWFADLAANAANPDFYAARLMRKEVGIYIWDLLWPVAFLPLGHARILLMLAGPAFVINSLAGVEYLVSVHYHYLYGIIPGIFAATVESLRSLERLTASWRLTGWVRRITVASAAGVVLLPALGFQVIGWRDPATYPGMIKAIIRSESGRRAKFPLSERLIAQLPNDARISASYNLVPFLTNRNWIFMFPNPWRSAYWGINGENLPVPELVDTLFLDTRAIGPELSQLARDLISSGWEITHDDSGILLARRVPKR